MFVYKPRAGRWWLVMTAISGKRWSIHYTAPTLLAAGERENEGCGFGNGEVSAGSIFGVLGSNTDPGIS